MDNMDDNGHIFGHNEICQICGAHKLMNMVTCAQCLETNRSHKWKRLVVSKAYMCLRCGIRGIMENNGEIMPHYVPHSGKYCQQLSMERALK
jgi:hypothetical protein